MTYALESLACPARRPVRAAGRDPVRYQHAARAALRRRRRRIHTAALLYAGAALSVRCRAGRSSAKRALARGDLQRLLAMAAFGAVIGPVALAWGLQRTSGTSASLMLTLEALFTALLAWRLYRESMDGRVWTGNAAAARRRRGADPRPRSRGGTAQLLGPARRRSRDRRLGHRQHVVACARRA